MVRDSGAMAACETDFYEQYEFSMLNVVLPKSVSPLISPDNLAALRREMAEIFDVTFDDGIMLVAHKLLPGQRIAIHNDYLVGKETHRLTVQLNRGLRDEDGGLFMLFNTFDPKDIHRIIRPVAGSGIGFEIGANSHHAVSSARWRALHARVFLLRPALCQTKFWKQLGQYSLNRPNRGFQA